MTASVDAHPTAHQWYGRPVFFVSDMPAALRFYVELLGFTQKWGSPGQTVCQVDRGGCEIILCQDRSRPDRGRLFMELTRDGVAELRQEIAARAVPAGKTWWGYDCIRIADPDGNELLFGLDDSNDDEPPP